MRITWYRQLDLFQPFRKRALIAVALAMAMVMGLGASVKPAKAAGADLLILSSTITKPDVHGNPKSVEEQAADSLGLTYDIVSPAQWLAMTTPQFAAYKALVLGDPTCGSSDLVTPTTNAPVWSAAVNGSVVAIGTDPTFHTQYFPGNGAASSGPRSVVIHGISFAASEAGRTGLYLTLSCRYHGTAPHTPVAVMNAAFGAGFSVTGVGCYNNSHIVATSPALLGLTDAALSNWSCSVHEAFDGIPSGWTVLAMAAGIGTSYTAPDGTVGTPYILARGAGLAPGNISLSPATQDAGVGTTATVTALTQAGGSPLAGQTVTFTVTSGPNAGLTGTGVTGASGTASFSYSSAVAGTDTLVATFTDPTGHAQTSNTATINWKVLTHNTSLTYDGATSGDFNDAVTLSATLRDTTASPVVGVGGKTINFTLGTQSCSGVTDALGRASCSLTITQHPGTTSVTASFAGDAQYKPSSDTQSFTINREDTSTTYTGATSGTFNDPAVLSGTLTDTKTGAPIAGKTLTFSVGTQSCSGTTDASGSASCSLVLNEAAGTYAVTAAFAGDTDNKPSSGTGSIVIAKEDTALTYTGSTMFAAGSTAHLSGTLTSDGTDAVAGRTVTFTLSNGQTCSGTTDASGNASCTVVVSGPLGPGTVTASFAGDGYYLPSAATATTLTFAFAAGGSFVIGDGNSAIGTSVTYWGAQWSRQNTLSGGSAPNSFKGFEDAGAPSCGSGWTTDPGNSTPPPNSVPSYMAVIVSSSISKHGRNISGDTVHIVVVQTNAGYQGNPGHAGTGTVVATLC